MKLTNKNKFPEAIYNAIKSDSYTKGEKTDFSCTELLQPPRIRSLKKKHWKDLEEDVEDRLWSLYGQITHSILERANETNLVEKRFYGEFDGFKVSAQIDSLIIENSSLVDYKFSTAYKFKNNQPVPEEWTQQLNIQLEILRQNGIDAGSIEIVGLIRDFSKMQALRDRDYPRSPIVRVPVEIWPREKTQAFIKHRISLHKMAEAQLPLCSDEERWATPTKFAVMKKGRKRALRLLETESEADKYAKEVGGYVELRPGTANRCKAYCAVKDFCQQYQSEIDPDYSNESEEKDAV